MTDAPTPPDVPSIPAKKRSRWSLTGIILSTVITVIGTATGVFTVVQALTRDTTNFSHLQISAASADGDVTEWAVPEALIEDVPSATNCDATLLDWLEVNAEPLTREITVNLRNDASEGAMLALTDFRAASVTADERGPISVRLVCDPSGSVPAQIYYGRIDVDEPDETARHVQLKQDQGASVAPSMPIAFNLAPGESGTIPFALFSRMPTSGSLEVTVLSGQEEQTVAIPDSEFDMPALLFAGDMYLLTTEDGLVCLQTDGGVIEECTLDDVAQELARAER